MFEGGQSECGVSDRSYSCSVSLMPGPTINIIHHRPIISPLFLRLGGWDRLFENLSPNVTFERGGEKKNCAGERKLCEKRFESSRRLGEE